TAFFPDGDPAVRDYQRASAQFGNDNVVFITYDDPDLLTSGGMERLGELVRSVQTEKIPAVEDVQSLDRMPLFWQIDDRLIDLVALPGFARRLAVNTVKASVASLAQENSPFTVGGALKAAQGESLKALRTRITTHPLLRDTLVSREGTSSALVVRVKPMEEQDPKQTVADLRSAADSFAKKYGLRRPAVVGPPVLLADGFSAIERDGRRLAIAGMGLIGLVILSVTQSLWWALVPILAGWVVWLAAEAAMAALGIRLSLSGGPLVAQIIVLTMPAASHLASHFRDALRSNRDRWSAARETIGAVRAPVIWTAVTGAIGYGALLSSEVVPVFQFGGVLAACTLVASLLTLVISPMAMLPPFPMEWPVKPGSTSRLARVMNGLTAGVVRHPAKVVLGTLLVVLPLSVGMFRLDYESNYINAFKPDTRVVQDYQFTENRLGGIGVVSVVMPAGETIDLGLIRRLRDLDQRVYDLRRGDEPAVSQVVSLATVLDPEGKLSALPEEKAEEAVKIKLELIQASPQGGLLRSFWSPRKPGDDRSGWTRLVIRISERQPAPEKEKTFEEALSLVRNDQGSVKSMESYVTGLSYLLTRTTRGVIASSWVTFLWSISGILLMLTLAFRGPRLAALALVPTLLSVGLV
ncbi:MAG TPA: MMPL family transporter, partial [Isosphaeraceae bacterium]|nr:MMPL family transporter [Isosphaeraceae bacterium]